MFMYMFMSKELELTYKNTGSVLHRLHRDVVSNRAVAVVVRQVELVPPDLGDEDVLAGQVPHAGDQEQKHHRLQGHPLGDKL